MIAPQFIRKQAAAKMLLVTVRSINRMIKQGELQGIKLSRNRSAVTVTSMSAYLNRRNARQSSTALPSTISRAQNNQSSQEPRPYASEVNSVSLIFNDYLPDGVAEAIDRHLSRRFGGVTVMDMGGGLVSISWPWSLPYTAEQISSSLRTLQS